MKRKFWFKLVIVVLLGIVTLALLTSFFGGFDKIHDGIMLAPPDAHDGLIPIPDPPHLD